MLPRALSLAAYRIARPVLFRMDAERIHRIALHGLARAGGNQTGRALLRAAGAAPRVDAAVSVAGITLRNRVGIGAGFDKDGVALRGWAALGLGFAEVGTVTPVAQPGNLRPRLFRLRIDEALINRMGFNNEGAAALAENVSRARRWLPAGFAVGINIGRGRAHPGGPRAGRLCGRLRHRRTGGRLRRGEHLVAEHARAACHAVGRHPVSAA